MSGEFGGLVGHLKGGIATGGRRGSVVWGRGSVIAMGTRMVGGDRQNTSVRGNLEIGGGKTS